jgi:hypothetical protein
MVSLSLRTLALAALLALSGAQSLSQQASTPAATFNDATEIVRRSLEADDRTAELSRNYTYQRYEVRKHLGGTGRSSLLIPRLGTSSIYTANPTHD